MTTTIALAAAAVWSVVALVAALFICRCISDPDYCDVELPGDETWLDDQPADVLADAAMRGRFNKTLIESGIEDF